MTTMTRYGMKLGFDSKGILRLISDTYGSLLAVISEMVQNALDAEAKGISITIDMKNGTLLVVDDGLGVSIEKLQDKLQMIGKSDKELGSGTLGQFGLGFFAPLSQLGPNGKMYFVSRDKKKGNKAFFKLVIDPAKLDHMSASGQGFPVDFPSNEFAADNTWWTTMVRLSGLGVVDKMVPTPQEIEGETISRFSRNMEAQKTKIGVRIVSRSGKENKHEFTARPYAGEPLEVVCIPEGHGTGCAEFRLFLTNRIKGGRVVAVGTQNNASLIPWGKFVQYLGKGLLTPEIIQALGSGVFEGVVTTSCAMMSTDRKSFKQSPELIDFCVAIEKWWETKGKAIYEMASRTSDAERYNKATMSALQELRKMLQGSEIKQALQSIFSSGSIGEGHSPVPKNRRIGELQGSTAVTGGVIGENNRKVGQDDQNSQSGKPKSNKVSVVSVGAGAKHRTIVRDEGFGIQVEHVALMGKNAWELDREFGIIRISTRHPDFAKAESGPDSVLERYISMIVLGVVSLIMNGAINDPRAKQTMDTMHGFMVDAFVGTATFNHGLKVAKSRELNARG